MACPHYQPASWLVKKRQSAAADRTPKLRIRIAGFPAPGHIAKLSG